MECTNITLNGHLNRINTGNLCDAFNSDVKTIDCVCVVYTLNRIVVEFEIMLKNSSIPVLSHVFAHCVLYSIFSHCVVKGMHCD